MYILLMVQSFLQGKSGIPVRWMVAIRMIWDFTVWQSVLKRNLYDVYIRNKQENGEYGKNYNP